MLYNEILKELREEAKLTQTELGKRFNCNQITISQYERGTRALSIEMLIKYADYFHVSTDYILCRDLKNSTKNQVNINGGSIGKITMKWGKIMSPEQLGNLINEGLFSGLYKAFELLFLTPPTCYIVYGMIVFTVALKILEKIIKKNRK